MGEGATEAETRVLEDEMGNLAAKGGGVGGAVGGGLGGGLGGSLGGGFGGAAGARKGARWATKRLPSDVCELSISAPLDPQAALTLCLDVVAELGRVLHEPLPPEVPQPAGWGVVAAKHRSPAVVTVKVAAEGSDGSAITIRGVSTEGLIKVHAGRAAATSVFEAVKARLAGAGEAT